MKWVAMFSQSGSEIYNLSARLGRAPDYIITNNDKRDTWHPGLEDLSASMIIGKHSELMELMRVMPTDALVTLHGYLRILPADIVERFEIINGHPGDVVLYPELKGKDPQAKAIELGLESTGVVLHKVITEVDAGDIIKYDRRFIHAGVNTEQLILDLKALQLDLWSELLRERI